MKWKLVKTTKHGWYNSRLDENETVYYYQSTDKKNLIVITPNPYESWAFALKGKKEYFTKLLEEFIKAGYQPNVPPINFIDKIKKLETPTL